MSILQASTGDWKEEPKHGQPGEPEAGLSPGQLAHELNNLLDGAMRSLRLGEDALARSLASGERELIDEARCRMRGAHAAMQEMMDFLRRLMQPETASPGDSPCASINDALDSALRAVEPMAEEMGVQVITSIEPDAAELPACELGLLIINGLRNAIASAAASRSERLVELSIATRPPRRPSIPRPSRLRPSELIITIADTGGGFDDEINRASSTMHARHGLGLGICRQIVHNLGGRLELRNIPFARGAVFHVALPMQRLGNR